MKKGLSVDVFCNASGNDFTLNGVSLKNDKLILLGSGVAGVFSPDESTPAVLLNVRNIYGNEYLSALPCDFEGKVLDGQWAFGGNFIYTSDSRFPSKQPIPVHDRDLRKENH